jgi:hypothetical protein
MPYASLQEAWGFQNQPTTCNGTRINNQFVVPNPNKSQGQLDNFFDRFYKDTNQVTQNYRDDSLDKRQRVNNAIEVTEPKRATYRKHQNWCDPCYGRSYFLSDDVSELSDPESDVCSAERNMVGKKLQIRGSEKQERFVEKQEKQEKPSVVKHEGFTNFNDCEGIMEHMRKCELCRAQMESMNQNIFIKEFIIFATSGVLMFIFLELIYRIARRQ